MAGYDVVVVGGGASGMMAAIMAGTRNKRVLLIERNNGLGKKLLMTGNGRCNITNFSDIESFLSKFSGTPDFLRNAFSKFFNTELIAFFENSGLKFKTADDGSLRVFPITDRAADVLKILDFRLRDGNVDIVFNERVKKVFLKNGTVCGVMTFSGKVFDAKKIVLATGGCSYPGTGSTGDGYNIAKALGHKVVAAVPALVPVCIKEPFARDWQGITLKNIRLTVFADNKKMISCCGDILFTHFGLSGPLILDVSFDIVKALRLKKTVELGIDFYNKSGNFDNLETELIKLFTVASKKSIKNVCRKFLPLRMISGFLDYCKINSGQMVSYITVDERRRLTNALSDLRLTVTKPLSVKDAVVTAGGVDLKEIDPRTMGSKIINGLYFAGELLNIDAKTGGYNLQAAFSTGWVCGMSV
ncbi:MAG: NAD(P)/FAD-dependent oxidoreductase [Candidatus Omnitrophica bacterium]|nr:NAD(P)/FAD-dependent oxidoreductase [Candidatus Omnitrophota bacterium]